MKTLVSRNGVEMTYVMVYLPCKHHEALKRLVVEEDTNMSALIRALIKQRVEHLL